MSDRTPTRLVPPDVLTEQALYSEKVRSVIKAAGGKLYAYVKTYGCLQNSSDSEKLRGMLAKMGYTLADSADGADLVLFNTCAIRENAEERVFGNIGALKHSKAENPGMLIGLCGCMAQQETTAKRFNNKFPFIDFIFGTHVMHTLPEIVYSALLDRRKTLSIPDGCEAIAEGLPVHRDSSFQARVSIMYGCDNFCTYCVVPYVRGRERSRDSADILREVGGLVEEGYKEILLLGQNVNSYSGGGGFPGLLRSLEAIPGDFRISYMTSHPKDCTKELIDTIAASRKISRHLHLPVQSGSNAVLRRMNRGYTREEYIALAAYAREKLPDITLTTDIIVGFPGETYEEFRETLSLLETVRFDSAFTFIYSAREGTRAAEMPDPVSREEKGRWFRELLDFQNKLGRDSYRRFVGKTLRVLSEGSGRTDKSLQSGKSMQGVIVDFEAEGDTTGSFVDVEITEALSWALVGKAVKK